MPKFTIYASYTYEMHGVEAASEDEVYQQLYDGEIDPRYEVITCVDSGFDVKPESE